MAMITLKKKELPGLPKGRGREEMTFFAGRVREVYRDFLGKLAKQHRAGASGLETARSCSSGVEIIVEHLYGSLLEWMGGKVRRVPAIVALGGFGRRELSPQSDVDLLFLWGKKEGREASVFAGYLVRMMWDAGLHLGHSVRTMSELRRALRKDLDLKTALLDGRWICGDDDLKRQLAGLKAEIRGRESGELLSAKLDEARKRWSKFGNSYHLIEPNIKESPGGLRDYQTIRWVGMVLPWEGTFRGLYRLAIIDKAEIRDIQAAFDFLVRTRNEVNFLSRSSSTVLTVEIQRLVANGLGYRNRSGFLAVERFMRDYYSNTRAIYRVLERILDEIRGKGNLRIIDGALYRRVGTKGLDQLDLRLKKEKLKADPLFVFKEQMRTGKRFSPHLERRIRTGFKAGEPGAAMVRKMRTSFIELLTIPGKKAPVIRSMHELGVLKRIFPTFEKLTCLKRYDLYHQYTTDEHSLQAIAYLEELGEKESGLLPRIFSEVAEKTELYLATLLHDIGKVRSGGHALAGAKMADRILKRFPISERSRRLICFLIRNHLLLTHFSQRRDMEDRDTSLLFIKAIENHLNLKLLYIITYTDLRATGTGIWTGWKEKLLEDLYFKASRVLAEKTELKTAYGNVLARRKGRILTSCEDGDTRTKMEKHLDGLPDRYAMIMSPVQARSHVAMIEELDVKLAVHRIRKLKHSLELTVCTHDRPFRLSQICGVITINDLNILDAYAFTRNDGVVIDLFHIEGIGGNLSLSSEDRHRLKKSLNSVLGDKTDLEKECRLHVERWKRRMEARIPVPCSVEFENELSRESTIIDITAQDRPGLLYRVTHVLSEEGLDIQSAQITTRGGVVEDSFYVKTLDRKKIGSLSTMRRIRQRLMAELEDGS